MGKQKSAALRLLGLGAAALAGAVSGGILVKKLWVDKYQKQKAETKAACREREILYQLLQLKQRSIPFSEFFEARHFETAAVLGMGREGRFLIDELEKEGRTKPAYGVEADYLGSVHKTLTVYRLGEDELPAADCLVVCDLNYTESKLADARQEFGGAVVTLEDLLDWLMEKHKIRAWRGQSTSSRPAK